MKADHDAVTLEHDDLRFEPGRGVYHARRAAELSGVPPTTLHYWARNGIYLPSVAAEPRVRLWSWGDLLAVRAIAWFRRSKGPEEPPPVTMRRIREALTELEASDIPRERFSQVVAVSEGGRLYIKLAGESAFTADPGRQGTLPRMLNLVQPFGTGPDLLRPRPLLRIIPGKLHGEPHIKDTRITSATIYALAEMGFGLDGIQRMYPEAASEALGEAIEFERSLRQAA